MNALLRLLILPYMIFQMSGGLRVFWPALAVIIAIGFGVGYLVRSFS